MIGQRDKKSTRRRCVPSATHTDVITRDAVDDQVVRASSICLRGGTSYVFAGSFWGRRPEAIADENGEVPPPGTPFHTTPFFSHLDDFCFRSDTYWDFKSKVILLPFFDSW